MSEASAEGSPSDGLSIQAVERALVLLEQLMREQESLSVRELSERTGVNRTTTHRLLTTLLRHGWVERTAGVASYRLGIRFLALATVLVRRRELFRELRPVLEEITELTSETVHVGVVDGLEVLHVDKIDSRERIGVSSQVGSRAPLHTTGLGKAILAASPDDEVDAYLAVASRLGFPARVADAQAFRREIERTRERGYSIDDEEDSVGVRCLGIAVRDPLGRPLLAISVTGPSPRFTAERISDLGPQLALIADRVSTSLGAGASDDVSPLILVRS